MAITRTKIHENAFYCIFQYLFYKYSKELTYRKPIEEIIQDVMEEPYDNCDPFFKAIIFETIQNEKEYSEIIEQRLNKWKLNRLDLAERAILLLSTSEIINKREKVQVIIDVALDLSHRYCDDESYRYINAVLDRISKEI